MNYCKLFSVIGVLAGALMVMHGLWSIWSYEPARRPFLRLEGKHGAVYLLPGDVRRVEPRDPLWAGDKNDRCRGEATWVQFEDAHSAVTLCGTSDEIAAKLGIP